MISPKKTRRNAVIALCLIWLLMCGGLAWATSSALQLQTLEDRARQDRSRDEIRSVAMERLDYLLAALLGPERTRPLDIFRAYYKPAKVFDAKNLTELDEAVMLPSPLNSSKLPDWVLLHFQASPMHGWSCPQLEHGAESATPASAMPAAERDRQASAANWLAALRDRYDPWSLLQLLEQAQFADFERRQTVDLIRKNTDVMTKSVVSENAQRDQQNSRRSASEFARRGARMLRLQREHSPEEHCEPQTVANENLLTGEEDSASPVSGYDCVVVSGTPMLPVWLDLTLDGRDQLALLRSVNVANIDFCTLQGVLIDWEKLRDILEGEIRELYPHAKILPVKQLATADPNLLHGIPARLVTGASNVISAGTSNGLRGGVWVAWITTLLSLMAISYGTMKYVTIAERRMQFVSAVTHELRTPLTSFQLYTDLLADLTTDDPVRRRQYVETLSRESQRLAQLVENVLVYSRMGDPQPAMHKDEVTPEFVLDTIAETTAERCKTAGKQLIVQNRCQNGQAIRTDSGFVVQILSHLVENACKYSAGATDPRITLAAVPAEDGGVAFEVDDAGQGIDPRDRRAIFEPFRRGEHTKSEDARTTGLGLGLALSRYWAECLGGQLMLRRSKLNGGNHSRFVLNLPGDTV